MQRVDKVILLPQRQNGRNLEYEGRLMIYPLIPNLPRRQNIHGCPAGSSLDLNCIWNLNQTENHVPTAAGKRRTRSVQWRMFTAAQTNYSHSSENPVLNSQEQVLDSFKTLRSSQKVERRLVIRGQIGMH